mgnify:CR=1 FL=1
MNTQSMTLLSILSTCSNNDQYLQHELKIQTILKMDSYLELANRESFNDMFINQFAEDKLRSYDDEKLNDIIDVLPYIPECLENIMYSLKNGNCWELTSANRPNFFDKQSIVNLIDMLEESDGKNYCNIDLKDYMVIFEDSTIKSIRPYFEQLPHNCQDYDAAIRQLLEPSKYCINENEIKALDEEYYSQESFYIKNIEAGEQADFKLTLLKILMIMICCSIPYLYGLASGNLTSEVQNCIALVVVAIGVVYYKKG